MDTSEKSGQEKKAQPSDSQDSSLSADDPKIDNPRVELEQESIALEKDVPKELQTGARNVPKDLPAVSTNVSKEPFTTGHITVESPTEPKVVTKKLSYDDVLKDSGLKHQPQPMRIHFQDVEDMISNLEKGIITGIGSDDLCLSTLMRDSMELRMHCFHDEANLKTQASEIANIETDNPSVDSELEDEDEALESREVDDIKDRISSTRNLMNQAKEAMELLMEIQEKGAAVLEDMDGDLFHSCRSLLMYVNTHIQKIEILAKDMEVEDPDLLSPVPWVGIKTMKRLIVDVSGTNTEGIPVVFPEEVQSTINKEVLLNEYSKYLANRSLTYKDIKEIEDSLYVYDCYASEFQQCCYEFRLTLGTGDMLATSTIEEQKEMFKWMEGMVRECYDYLAAGTRDSLNILDQLDKFVTANRKLYEEMRSFLYCEMNLFGTD